MLRSWPAQRGSDVRLVLFALLGTAASAQMLTFSPQGGGKVVVWTVSGCTSRAVPISQIYIMASLHGIPWMTSKTAGEIFAKKSGWSRAVRVAGFLSAGGAVVAGSDWVKAKPQLTTALAIGGTVLVVLVPLAQREIPKIDPDIGQPLMLSVDGCGTTSFYAFPSNIAGFSEVIVPR